MPPPCSLRWLCGLPATAVLVRLLVFVAGWFGLTGGRAGSTAAKAPSRVVPVSSEDAGSTANVGKGGGPGRAVRCQERRVSANEGSFLGGQGVSVIFLACLSELGCMLLVLGLAGCNGA